MGDVVADTRAEERLTPPPPPTLWEGREEEKFLNMASMESALQAASVRGRTMSDSAKRIHTAL